MAASAHEGERLKPVVALAGDVVEMGPEALTLDSAQAWPRPKVAPGARESGLRRHSRKPRPRRRELDIP